MEQKGEDPFWRLVQTMTLASTALVRKSAHGFMDPDFEVGALHCAATRDLVEMQALDQDSYNVVIIVRRIKYEYPAIIKHPGCMPLPVDLGSAYLLCQCSPSEIQTLRGKLLVELRDVKCMNLLVYVDGLHEMTVTQCKSLSDLVNSYYNYCGRAVHARIRILTTAETKVPVFIRNLMQYTAEKEASHRSEDHAHMIITKRRKLVDDTVDMEDDGGEHQE